jgi:hypothetical protein
LPNFYVLDLDILPVAVEPLRSLGDAECLITSVTIPLPPLPLGSPELPDVDVAPLELSDVAALPPPKKTRLPATSTMIPTPAATEDAVGKRRSSRLRAKEAPLRETVADAAVRLKKRKLGAATSAGNNNVDSDAAPASATPAWCLQDLQLLGRACGVPDGHLLNLDGCPVPAVDPLD